MSDFRFTGHPILASQFCGVGEFVLAGPYGAVRYTPGVGLKELPDYELERLRQLIAEDRSRINA